MEGLMEDRQVREVFDTGLGKISLRVSGVVLLGIISMVDELSIG
jgi:hypothetical protein